MTPPQAEPQAGPQAGGIPEAHIAITEDDSSVPVTAPEDLPVEQDTHTGRRPGILLTLDGPRLMCVLGLTFEQKSLKRKNKTREKYICTSVQCICVFSYVLLPQHPEPSHSPTTLSLTHPEQLRVLQAAFMVSVLHTCAISLFYIIFLLYLFYAQMCLDTQMLTIGLNLPTVFRTVTSCTGL